MSPLGKGLVHTLQYILFGIGLYLLLENSPSSSLPFLSLSLPLPLPPCPNQQLFKFLLSPYPQINAVVPRPFEQCKGQQIKSNHDHMIFQHGDSAPSPSRTEPVLSWAQRGNQSRMIHDYTSSNSHSSPHWGSGTVDSYDLPTHPRPYWISKNYTLNPTIGVWFLPALFVEKINSNLRLLLNWPFRSSSLLFSE